jgi:hypothetical protein
VFNSDLPGNLVSAFNRGAEKAAPQAGAEFIKAITGMNIADGKEILFSQNNYAATDYLKKTTLTVLTAAFSPIITETIKEAANIKIGEKSYDALDAWSLYAKQNNNLVKFAKSKEGDLALKGLDFTYPEQAATIRSISIVEEDLGGHVVKEALGGVFEKVSKEEENIRTNVNARTSNLLRDVFGEADKKKQK